jgi:hypothetical protein
MASDGGYLWGRHEDLEEARLDLLEEIYDLATHDCLPTSWRQRNERLNLATGGGGSCSTLTIGRSAGNWNGFVAER